MATDDDLARDAAEVEDRGDGYIVPTLASVDSRSVASLF